MIKVSRVLASASVLLTPLVLAACGGGGGGGGDSAQSGGVAAGYKTLVNTPITAETPKPSGDIAQVTWDLPYGEPASLDPLRAYALAENTVFSNLCDSLYRYGPDLKLEPGIATSTERPDAKTYVFKIRSGVKFWDGQPLTPQDVAYSLNRQIDPKNGSYYSLYARFLKRASVTGADEVTLKLSQPNELIEVYLASALGSVIEKKFAEDAGSKYGTPKGGVMCSGAFKFESWQPGNKLTMVKNPDYWDEALRPRVGTVDFRFITDPSALTNGLRSGQLDGAFYVPIASIPQLETSGAGKIFYGKNLISSIISPIQKSGPLFDRNVRLALSKAIDRNGIAQAIYGGHAAPTNWPWGTDSFGYEKDAWQAAYDSQPLSPTADVAGAKKLLEGNKNASKPIVIAVLTGDQTSINVALAVQSAAKEIGLTVVIKTLQPTQFVQISIDAKSRVGIDAYIGSNSYLDFADPLIWLYYFAPQSEDPAVNPEGYDNPEQNALLDKALATTDPKERMQFAIPAAKIFAKEQPVVPIVQFPLAMFMSNKITGTPTSHSTFLYYPWAAKLGAK